MAPWTWSPRLQRTIIFPFLRASVPSRNQETVPPNQHPTLPLATQSHRATCHQHARTVSPWYLVRHRATTVPPPCHRATCCATVTLLCPRAATVSKRHINIFLYTHAPGILYHASDSCQSYLRTSWTVWCNFTIWSVANKKPWLL